MASGSKIRKLVFPALYVMFLAAIVLFGLALSVMRQAESRAMSRTESGEASTPATPAASPSPTVSAPVPTATPVASPTAGPTAGPNFTPSPNPGGTPVYGESTRLIVPVAGVRSSDLRDTYLDARDENRLHDAIDIPAAKGTPVIAAADGVIKRLYTSERGGLTLYQIGRDQRTVYYYAHLDAYAEGLVEGRQVRQGEVIAYVGDTGNAGPGNYHLHFAIWTITDPSHFWGGMSTNPYPLLRNAP